MKKQAKEGSPMSSILSACFSKNPGGGLSGIGSLLSFSRSSSGRDFRIVETRLL